MMNNTQTLQNPPATAPKWGVQDKWGNAVTGGKKGFFAVPDLLIKNQAQIPLSNTEVLVVMNLLLHWWDAGNLPHPRPAAIARRMGKSTRTVERAIESLEAKRLVKRKVAERSRDGVSIRRFDLRGLVEKLQMLG